MTTIQATLPATSPSTAKVWTGRVMGGIVILFMLMDTSFKFIVNEDVIKGIGARQLFVIGDIFTMDTHETVPFGIGAAGAGCNLYVHQPAAARPADYFNLF